MSHDQIRRALDDAMNRSGANQEGMTVGLPKVTVDASQLRQLLATCDHWQDRTEKAEAELARVLERAGIVERYLRLNTGLWLAAATDLEEIDALEEVGSDD